MITPRSIIGLILGSFLVIIPIWAAVTDGFPIAGSTNRALMFFEIVLGIAFLVGSISELKKPEEKVSIKDKKKKNSKE